MWKQQGDIADACREEQFKGMNDKIDRVDKKVVTISGDLRRVM